MCYIQVPKAVRQPADVVPAHKGGNQCWTLAAEVESNVREVDAGRNIIPVFDPCLVPTLNSILSAKIAQIRSWFSLGKLQKSGIIIFIYFSGLSLEEENKVYRKISEFLECIPYVGVYELYVTIIRSPLRPSIHSSIHQPSICSIFKVWPMCKSLSHICSGFYLLLQILWTFKVGKLLELKPKILRETWQIQFPVA